MTWVNAEVKGEALVNENLFESVIKMAKPGPAAKGLKLEAFPMEFGRVFNLGKLKEISVLYLL